MILFNASTTYNLGTSTKAWNNVWADTFNAGTINATDVNVGGIDLSTRHANTIYVAENGSNNNAGNPFQSPNDSRKSVAKCNSRRYCSIYPGVYQERLLVIPGVTVKGHSMRGVTIKPDSVDSEDVFLNGETTVEDLTIQDFYYDSGNDVGYAFKFAPISSLSRSPYVRNVTVITKGSVTNASDPRGFNPRRCR